MAAEIEAEPNYDTLIAEMLDKTRAGKLRWEETAEEDTFVAAVRGVQTFEISAKRKVDRVPVPDRGSLSPPPVSNSADSSWGRRWNSSKMSSSR